ncbi:LysR family transcriptional regulator [Pyxidicoccus xibeiensis]|uniref:LysR family transcriptional regulator n=1 Tax=Pyxidicoccus xibeiensis TaxID=2906759 RepID=UPI0020A7F891|nr:LysR family transcriptional regulator [Pyxidicoccus xibeiensis]MCP3138262.1 LysR family transcriptional regulator [Pyxidicoccus xibeiensis]
MKRDELNDLAAFVAIAEERSFTRAASKLGMSPSALSHAMKALEGRLGVRLLARTTRSVATTAAGEQLLKTLRPAFEEISAGLTHLDRLRDKPAGTVRITTFKHAAATVIWPVLPGFMREYPDIRVEVSIDDRLTDIVESRFDAGIRFSEKVARDMVAVRVGPDVRFAVVGTPSYFAEHPVPKTPRALVEHRCINYRMPTSGALGSWEFERSGRTFQVRVDGPLIVNDVDLVVAAALTGQGLAFIYEDMVANHIAAGRLIRVLGEWCPSFPAYFLYYPSRRQVPPALAAFVEAVRSTAPRRRSGRGASTTSTEGGG